VFKEAKLKVFPEILYTHNDIFYNNQARISIIKPSKQTIFLKSLGMRIQDLRKQQDRT
jgi:hypothetical protein